MMLGDLGFFDFVVFCLLDLCCGECIFFGG